MTREWIDVADTVIKIGLGTLITGVFAHLGARFAHKAAQKRFLLEYRIKLLEQIAADTENYFNAWNEMVRTVKKVSKEMDDGSGSVTYADEQLKRLKKRSRSLMDALNANQMSLSRLRLLKASPVIEKYMACIYFESGLRSAIIDENEYFNLNQITEYKEKAKSLQKDFQHALADFYEDASA